MQPKPTHSLCILLLVIYFIGFIHSDPTLGWKKYNIYQIVTDRFARGPGSPPANCVGEKRYCGGTWADSIDKLDYIKGMGFNAVWISPIPLQIDDTPNGDGFHGYWFRDLSRVNPHFGSSQDLKTFVDAAHDKDIAVIVDVVANHVGPVDLDFTQIYPFNKPEHYHKKCQITNWQNQTDVQYCRLANLPDLDQNNPYVSQQLNNWMDSILKTYGFDGVRIDTVPHINKQFWKTFRQTIGQDKFTTGEVFNGDVNYLADYANILGSTLSYPLYFSLKGIFGYGNSMFNIRTTLNQYKTSLQRPDLQATFIDNHDNARFLNYQHDMKKYKNALTFVLLAQGIPIIYYGTEQGFSGGNDPWNREMMFNSFNTKSPLYLFIQRILSYKNQNSTLIAQSQHIERFVEDNIYCFSRDQMFVAVTNVGSSFGRLQYTITYHPYQNNQVICDIFWGTLDCVTVQNGQFDVVLLAGESKVFVPKEWIISQHDYKLEQ